MDQRTKELWVIPSVISLASGTLLLVVSKYITALITGVALRLPFTVGWIKSILLVRLPLWGVLLVVVATAGVMVYLRKRAQNKPTSSESFVSPFETTAFSKGADAQESIQPRYSVLTIGEPQIQNLSKQPTASFHGDSLVIASPDQFSVRLSKFEDGAIRGIQMRMENHRLVSIQRDRVVLSTACSFDSRYGAYRESCLSAQVFERPEVIRPSSASNPIRLVWKAPQWPGLVTGENNYVRQLLWPEMDKSEVERWKLSLRVNASERPINAERPSPLRELQTDIVVLWARQSSEFEMEELSPVPSPPAPPTAFPSSGKDGTRRTIALFIMYGEDRLLSYTTTREDLPGIRFLVVRERPKQAPQSIETPDRDAANAKWNEWYQEWRKRGFGGASGNGLDGVPPF